MMNLVVLCWVLSFYWLRFSNATRSLFATSLVSCMEDSQLTATSFDVVFYPDSGALHYTLYITTEISGNVTAVADVWAYGFKIIEKEIDPCDISWKQFCPLYPGVIEIESIEYLSDEYTDQIPGIAYEVPDIDAYVRLNIYQNNSTEPVGCLQAYFSNGKTVSQTGVKWATAVIAGIGLLTSATLSAFGNSNAASHIAANTMSLFLYFQSVAVVSMEHVHRVPQIAAAWCENLIWSMGLIRVGFMQEIFRWYVQSTGGSPTTYLTSSTISILVQRSIDYVKSFDLYKRAEDVLYGNSDVLIFRGIKRVGYSAGIEPTSIVCTGFTFFYLCAYFLIGFIIACKFLIEWCIRIGWMKNSRFIDFRNNWIMVLKGAMMRYIYIGFTQVSILGFWEFFQRDSPAVIVVCVLTIVMVYSIIFMSSYRTRMFAKRSIELHNNPAAMLYGDHRILTKHGFFYTMFAANRYYWGSIIMVQSFCKGAFIAFAQASGKTQALSLFLIDLAYFAAVIYYKPFLDRATNILNILISAVTLINSFFFMFFSDLFGQPNSVSSIMGWIFFILNAAFSLILLIMILIYMTLAIISKNPDARFKPANDDRTSFQKLSANAGAIDKSVADELLALGKVAKDHDEDWQDHLVVQQSYSDSTNSDNEKISSNPGKNTSRKASLRDKVMRKISLKRNNSATSQSSNSNLPSQVTNMSPSENAKEYTKTHKRIDSEAQQVLIDHGSELSFQDDSQNIPASSLIYGRSSSTDSLDKNNSFTANAMSSTDIFEQRNNSNSFYNL